MNKNSEIRVSVAGASGYAGGELVRYLSQHPKVNLQSLLANSQSGQSFSSLFPNLRGVVDKTLTKADWAELSGNNDVVFLCLPHGKSQTAVQKLLEGGCKVVDLGADFRLKSPELYAATYGEKHSCPELLREAVYGLPEMTREAVKKANLVANPGCYPTASTLGLLPLVGKVKLSSPPVIDAKSGVSGAGRGLKMGSLYCEVNENFQAYAVGCHRHQPEIQQNLGQPVLFTPHLAPMTRGILATIYVAAPHTELQELYQDFYQNEPFVEVLTESLPTTKSVSGTNLCKLAVRPSGVEGHSVIVSVIDNLGKGAAGTAVHNMNLMFGLPEEMGLGQPALLP